MFFVCAIDLRVRDDSLLLLRAPRLILEVIKRFTHVRVVVDRTPKLDRTWRLQQIMSKKTFGLDRKAFAMKWDLSACIHLLCGGLN